MGLTHVVGREIGDDGGRLLSLLLTHLPSEAVHQSVLVLAPCLPAISWPKDIEIACQHIGQRWDWPPAAGLDIRRSLERGAGPMLLAWGVDAGAAAYTAAGRQGQLAVIVLDPGQAQQAGRWWRSIQAHGKRIPIICTSGHVQRRLIEHGVFPDATAVIRPGVDYAALGQAREHHREIYRQELFPPTSDVSTASPSDLTILLTLPSPSRAGGQYHAAWAAALIYQARPNLRMIIPGKSREQERIRRLVDEIYCPHIYRFTENELSWSELLGMSDLLAVPAADDICTDAIGWAMAAGIPIVASATPCITKLLADHQNALLCKSDKPYPLAIRLQAALNSPELSRECTRTARTQAFSVFRTQRCVEAFLKLIRNLNEHRPAFTELQDAAQAG